MKLSKVVIWIFYLFSFTIPINQFFSTRLLVVLALISLFLKGFSISRLFLNSWPFLVYLLVLISGLFYTSDLKTGLTVLEASFPLLALPLIINKLSFYEDDLFKNSVKVFLGGLLVASLVSIVSAISNFLNKGRIESFYYYSLTETIGYQPTYFAYYLIFAISYILYSLYYKSSNFSIWPSSVLLMYFFVILLFTGGNTAFISLLMIFSFFLLKFILEKKELAKVYLLVGILSMLAVMLVVKYSETSTLKAESLNDSWDRFAVWESTVKAVPNVFFGVGTGDYKVILNDYFNNHGLIDFARNNMNAHNQVLHLLLSNGFIGILSFLFMIFMPIYRGVKSQNMLLIITLFPFIIYGITEVFLGRYQGVVFFGWLVQIQMFDWQRELPSIK